MFLKFLTSELNLHVYYVEIKKKYGCLCYMYIAL